jgi:hypothetical protein
MPGVGVGYINMCSAHTFCVLMTRLVLVLRSHYFSRKKVNGDYHTITLLVLVPVL